MNEEGEETYICTEKFLCIRARYFWPFYWVIYFKVSLCFYGNYSKFF